MRVLIVAPSLEREYGGPSKAVLDNKKWLGKYGVKVDIATTYREKTKEYCGDGIFAFPSSLGNFRYSPKLSRWLDKNITNYDLVQIDTIFHYSTYISSKKARMYGIPYVIQPHGMLEDKLLTSKSRWKKKVFLQLVKDSLDNADAIILTSKYEEKTCGVKLPKDKFFIQPLGIEVLDEKGKTKIKDFFPELENKRIILFLSRIHPKKGLEILLHSIGIILREDKNLALVVAGSGDKAYEDKLKSLVEEEGLGDSVVFTGFVGGNVKKTLFQNSVFFILSSHSENFGVAVVEAMSYGLPVLVSDTVGVADDILEYNAGLVFKLDKKSIEDSVRKALSNRKLLKRLGVNGKRLVGDRFHWKKTTPQQIDIYKKIISQ
ncbi:MAG: glycosyltransferase [Candidatus Altiarchaeota archaeon]|nr:glycosyltransferase [Candidatus Altiarchaeota archaeon]